MERKAMSAGESAFHRMHLEEMTERAWLFYNLKRDRKYARERLLQNLEWEFEVTSPASLRKKVDEIINRVYSK